MTRTLPLLVAIACVVGCSPGEPARTDDQFFEPQADQASFSILKTSWTYFGGDGQPILETIDDNGKYVSTAGSKVTDRGTVIMVGGKACFDSALSSAPPNCWEVPETAVGETKDYVDNHGQRLRVTRVAYVER